MSDVVVRIRGLEVAGRHGVHEAERVLGQRFVADIDMVLAHDRSTTTDDLADTVDYGALTDAIRAIVAGESHQLLERLAARIAEVCRSDPRVTAATVEVRKMEPPIEGAVGHVAVRIER